jgi:hypothetical protein
MTMALIRKVLTPCSRATARGQAGQSAIEFALALPILVLLLVGSMSLGRMAYDTMIVQELTDEAAKMGGIDRLTPDKSEARQMTDQELVDWIRESAHTEDNHIDQKSIGCDPNFIFTGGDPSQLPKGSDVYKNLTNVLSGGGTILAPALNPSIETIHLKYNYDTALGPGLNYTVKYQFHFTKYQMVWLPLVAAATGGSTASATCSAPGS